MTTITADRITDDNVQDVVDTAAYGGITYWATEPNWAAIDIPDGTRATIVDRNDQEVYFLTDHQIRRAIVEVAQGKHTNNQIRDYVRSAFDNWTAEDGIWCGDIDADAADCIIQVACFGEILYG